MEKLAPVQASPPLAEQMPVRLLIPIDATDASRWAINYAIRCALAGAPVEVFLLYIIEPVTNWEVLRFHSAQEVHQHFATRAAIFLAEAAEALAEAGIPCHRYCREDETVRGILTFAEEKGCSQIVVPDTLLWGRFPCGLARKLRRQKPSVPVVRTTANGSLAS